jgi:phosphatidylserine decarboxylase
MGIVRTEDHKGKRTFRSLIERGAMTLAAHPALSRSVGWLADRRLPGPVLRAAIRTWVSAYGVDLAEAEEPAGGYDTFNAFFTRALRSGARPIADGQALLVSPCDAILTSLGRVSEDGRLEQVKGKTYALGALLASEEEAEPFRHGTHATLYLSPGMYHRVHAPDAGWIVGWRYVPGRLFPVNRLGLRHVAGLFAVNERVVIQMETDDLGPVRVVMVGATNVARISLAFTGLVTNQRHPAGASRPPEPIPVRRGDEIGVFNLGSTVVLLAAESRLDPAAVVPGQRVRMGQPLLRRP